MSAVFPGQSVLEVQLQGPDWTLFKECSPLLRQIPSEDVLAGSLTIMKDCKRSEGVTKEAVNIGEDLRALWVKLHPET